MNLALISGVRFFSLVCASGDWVLLPHSCVRPHIVNAWKCGDDIAGVLLKKYGFEFTSIYMTAPKLADKLANRADLYVDFREVRKELGL